jgi:hypothetical protein
MRRKQPRKVTASNRVSDYPLRMAASGGPQPPGGRHRVADTDPVRRWDDNLFQLWLDLAFGHFGLRSGAVLVGLFAALTAGIMLWPGASTSASYAIVYALIAVGGLYGLLWLTALVVGLLLSVARDVRSLGRFLRRR